jgi:hypothetical protein
MDNRMKLRWSTTILPLVVNVGAWTYLVLSTPKEDRSFDEVNSIAQSLLMLLLSVVGFVVSNTWLIHLLNERLIQFWLSMDTWAATITPLRIVRSDSYIGTDACSGSITTKYKIQVEYSVTNETTGTTKRILKGWEGIKDAALFEAARDESLTLRVLKPFPTVAMPQLSYDEEQDISSRKCHERCCKDCQKPVLYFGGCFSLIGLSCWMLLLSLERTHLEDNSLQDNSHRHETLVVATTWVICVVLAWMITFNRVFFHGAEILEVEQAEEGGFPKAMNVTEVLED